MASKRSSERPTIGVLAGWQYYWTARPLSYLGPVYRGIRQAAQDLDCNLLLACGMGPQGDAEDPLRPAWLTPAEDSDFTPVGPWNTQGLIFINPLNSRARSRTVQEIRADGHPVIFVGAGEEGPTVMADNGAGIFAALEHLTAHGHRTIAFIAGNPTDLAGDTGDRLRAFQQSLLTFNLDVDDRLVVFGDHTYAGGYTAIGRLLATGVPFTAVVASNDESAFGAMQALREAGRRIPEDVAIIGFDDRPECLLQQPALTSVHIPLYHMGYRAVELLLQQVRGEQTDAHPVKILTRLIIRESCGCRRNRDIAHVGSAPTVQSTGAPRDVQAQLVERMSSLLLERSHGLAARDIVQFCQRLVASFVASVETDAADGFHHTLESVLEQVVAARDDAHEWQAALSALREALPTLARVWSGPDALQRAHRLLDEARIQVSDAMRLQHWAYVNEQRHANNHIGRLTARLLTALEEEQVYDILAQHLPEMDLHTVWVAFFEGEGEDPVAWNRLRAVTEPQQPTLRLPSRAFPPRQWRPNDRPFHLALIPLVGHSTEAGFVALDAVHLDLHGAIVQQLSAALSTARLYQAAQEGRRLAEEANQIKSRFLSMVSHELRTPLNLIVGMSGLLLQEHAEGTQALPAQVQEDLKGIYANARHLGRLISDVLDLASSDAGQLRLTWDLVDLSEVLRGVADMGRQLAADKGLTWRASFPESGPWVRGDRTRLQQVALNLVANAVKFTAQGEVHLRLEEEAGAATVYVRDTGLGLSPEEQQAIFDEFQRSERSVRRGYGGIGLGLAICKRLVNLHGGEIGVWSSGVEGEGSEFYFRLPTVTAPATKPQAASPEDGAPPRIMVLSSAGEEQRLHAYLTRRGFQVAVYAIHENDAWLNELLQHTYTGVLVHVDQADTAGWQAIKLLKANPVTQEIPTLFYAADESRAAVLELDYLTKPVELAALTRAIEQHRLDADEDAHTYLVVDDDPNTLDLHTRIIQSQAPGRRVLRARSGKEALDILAQERVDLVLLDLMMPELDGFGVLEAMRARPETRDIPVIVITGQVLTEADMERLNRGVATVMSKGLFSLDETLAHLEAALARRRRLSREAQALVRKAMAYMHSHYTTSISRQDVAQYVGMSEDYLTHCFRQELGMSPIAYLNRYRVLQAQRLLQETDKDVTTIALEVGFSSSSYFSRIFKRHTGVSPLVYRRAGGKTPSPNPR